MALVFTCPCGNQLKTEDQYAGLQVRCPRCSTVLIVPFASGGKARPAAPAPAPTAVTPVIPASPPPHRSAERREHEPQRAERAHEPAAPAQTSRKAVVALVLGLVALGGSTTVAALLSDSWFALLVMGCGTGGSALLCGLPALLFGLQSLGDIKRSHGRLAGGGMARTGIALGVVGSICSLFCCTCGGYFSGKARVQESATRMQSSNNLKQIGLAMANYEATTNGFPAGAIYSKEGKPLLSWRVAILPYIEQEPLYNQFHLDEAWDSPHNKPLLAKMPRTYAAPGSEAKTDLTYYRIFHRKDPTVGGREEFSPLFTGNLRCKFSSISRGTFNTILVVEAADAVPWTKPDELTFPVSGAVEPLLGGIFKDRFHVLLADGSVRFFQKGNLSDKQLKAAITVDNPEEPLPK